MRHLVYLSTVCPGCGKTLETPVDQDSSDWECPHCGKTAPSNENADTPREENPAENNPPYASSPNNIESSPAPSVTQKSVEKNGCVFVTMFFTVPLIIFFLSRISSCSPSDAPTSPVPNQKSQVVVQNNLESQAVKSASQIVQTKPSDRNQVVASNPKTSEYKAQQDREALARECTPDYPHEGDEINVGYMSYKIEQSWWSDRLTSGYMNEDPDAAYLFVKITVRNNDRKPRMVPSFKLVGPGKREYVASPNAALLREAIDPLSTLNPGVAKTGVVVFDLPESDDIFGFIVSGGFWSSEEKVVVLCPRLMKHRK